MLLHLRTRNGGGDPPCRMNENRRGIPEQLLTFYLGSSLRELGLCWLSHLPQICEGAISQLPPQPSRVLDIGVARVLSRQPISTRGALHWRPIPWFLFWREVRHCLPLASLDARSKGVAHCPVVVCAGDLPCPPTLAGLGRVTRLLRTDGMLVQRPLSVECAIATQADVTLCWLSMAPKASAASRYFGPRTSSIVRVVGDWTAAPPANGFWPGNVGGAPSVITLVHATGRLYFWGRGPSLMEGHRHGRRHRKKAWDGVAIPRDQPAGGRWLLRCRGPHP